MTNPLLSLDLDPDAINLRLGGSNPSPDVILVPMQGATGPAGSSFEFVQASPLASWVIVHNLNDYPQVTVNVAGSLALAEVTYDSLIQCTVKFARAQSGSAHLN